MCFAPIPSTSVAESSYPTTVLWTGKLERLKNIQDKTQAAYDVET